MRKLFVLMAATLCCLSAFAQEAESVDNGTQLTIIPRIDINPTIPINGDAQGGFSLGNSSLYTLFEGSISDNLSFSVSNHWLSTDPGSLYTNTWHSDYTNWCDWAYLNLTMGDFDLTVGKDMMAVSTFEEDEYDYNSFYELSSKFWYNCNVYQWGGKLTYNLSDALALAAQMTTSPFGERPFSSGMYAYALQARGEAGAFGYMASGHMIDAYDGTKAYLGTAGLQSYIGDVTLGVDYMLSAYEGDLAHRVLGTVSYSPCEKLDLMAKAGWEQGDLFTEDSNGDYLGGVFGGIAALYYPLRDSRDLKLHCVVATNNLPALAGDFIELQGRLSVNIGATYYFNLPFGRR